MLVYLNGYVLYLFKPCVVQSVNKYWFAATSRSLEVKRMSNFRITSRWIIFFSVLSADILIGTALGTGWKWVSKHQDRSLLSPATDIVLYWQLSVQHCKESLKSFLCDLFGNGLGTWDFVLDHIMMCVKQKATRTGTVDSQTQNQMYVSSACCWLRRNWGKQILICVNHFCLLI